MDDVLIIGGGSAGCVLANRLSADPARQVRLLEAGGEARSPAIRVPLGLALLARLPGLNWGHQTAVEPALDGRRLFWPRGRVLGGSSAINAMIYARGHPADYADWARAAGADWGWDRVRAAFIRLEGNADLGPPHHGTGGPLAVANLRSPNPLSRAFVAAGVACQFPENRDFNGAGQDGVGLYQVTQRDGRRCSAAGAFLDPVRTRPNLTVETGAVVHRVLIEDRRAVGVRLADGTERRVAPAGLVILSGGAIASPRLLLLSGIGPAADLAAMGIPVIADRPEVGANLADHLDVTVLARSRDRAPIALAPTFLPRALRAGWQFLRGGTGELTSNVAEAGGFVRSDPGRDRPNLQFHFIPALLRDHGRVLTPGYGVTLHVCDLLPRSRGRVRLAGPDPDAPARIEPGYLSHPDDLPVLRAGVRIARRILGAPPLADRLAGEWLPGPAVRSDADLDADIRARAETIYHPVGTCRMGTDPASVVDPQGRVRGVDGLRVVDASIMPAIIAGNTSAPTMMIAEIIAGTMTAAP